MGYLVCNKCGSCHELREGESIDDFDLTCNCGGKFRYEESINSNNKSDLDNIKWILIFVGFVFILIFLGRYFESKSPLDLFYLTIGMLAIIWGFYVKEDFKGTSTYFVAILCVNIIQWLILIYILFISPDVTDLLILALAPIVTLSLIFQIRRSDLKYIGNPQKTNKDAIFVNKMKRMLGNKAKIFYTSIGVLIILVCSASFLFSKSPLELYGSLVGLMVFVYGYYRDGFDGNKPNYSPGMSHNSIYREVKNVNVTVNYFLAMFGVIMSQWLIICYFIFIYPVYVPHEVYLSDVYGLSWAITISFFATFYFYIQIRESHLIKINWQGIFIGGEKIF